MAGFNTAVTGLKAAQTDLDVTGNNIANSSTVGFKTSRTEFGDIYATAVVGAGSANVAGSGVTVADIAQDFQAGTIEFTNNNLDLAINGSGFFQLDDGQGGVTYTRAGSFELNKDGAIVSKNGKFLKGYGLDDDGNQLPLGNLAVTQKESPPKATESIDLSFNIDDREDASKLGAPYDKDEPSTFTYSTTVRTFDSLGNEHTIKYNFAEQRPVREVQTLDFNTLSGNVDISGATVNLATLRSLGGIGEQQSFSITGTATADGAVSVDIAAKSGTIKVPVTVNSTDGPLQIAENIAAELNRAALPGGSLDGVVDSVTADNNGKVVITYTVAQENIGAVTFSQVTGLAQGVEVQEATVDDLGFGGIMSFAFKGEATADGEITMTIPNPGGADITLPAVSYAFGDSAEKISNAVATAINNATATGGTLDGIVSQAVVNSTSGRIELTYDNSKELVSSSADTLNAAVGNRTDPDLPLGVTFPANAAAITTDTAYVSGDNAQEEADKILAADSRISLIEVDRDNNDVILRFKAEATDPDPVQVDNATAATLNQITATELAANEVHSYQINDGAFDTDGLIKDTILNIGGVEIQLDKGMNEEAIANSVLAREAQIRDQNPDVESVTVTSVGTDYKVNITFKAESNVDDNLLSVVVGDVSEGSGTVPVLSNKEVTQGDNSFQGVYRMYAYLNGEEQLNLGKVVDPGEAGFSNNQTEVGPIILKFNPTNGFLSSVNGSTFPSGSDAPKITIEGADPANPLTKIEVDLTGSTQFSSASIVKSSSQDGYTKGDLVGVTFSETGEMVASFSNGQNQELGIVAIATFENQSGLQPSGDTEWTATLTSGDAILNPPGTGLNGTLRSAALEQSNVDLSAELVNLIEAQRNFQANSKTLETLNNVTQSILQI